jgi:hypothetical protein
MRKLARRIAASGEISKCPEILATLAALRAKVMG